MLTFAVAALGLLATAQNQPTGQLSQLIKQRTFKNGMEEYVLAADMYDHASNEIKGLEQLCLAAPGDPNLLQNKRRMARLLQPVLNLVKQGNKKPAQDLHEKVDAQTLFPEYAKFKTLAKLMVGIDAQVSFADGYPVQGVENLTEALRFGYGVSHSKTIIGDLVGIAIRAIALSGFEEHLSRIPEGSLKGIGEAATAMLPAKPIISDVMASEMQFTKSMLHATLQDPKMLAAELSGDQPAPSVGEITPERAKRIESVVCDELDRVLLRVQTMLAQPENTWSASKGIPAEAEMETTDPLAKMVASAFASSFPQAILAEAKSRTQLRLLRLHAAILSFKWNSGRLPNTLEELGNDEITKDPLSGGLFQFTRTDRGGYELYSVGSPDTGRIDLKYRRDPSASTGPGDGLP